MQHKELKLGIAQLSNSIDWKRNCSKAKRIITNFAKENVDIVCFQEAYLSGYHGKIFQMDFDKIGPLLEQIKAHAYKKNICVVLPTIENRGKYYYSTAYIYNSDRGDKIIYKEGLTPSEKTIMRGKKSKRIFSANGVNLGLLLCREMQDPVYTYLDKNKKPDLILWPAYWGWKYHSLWGAYSNIDGKKDKCFDFIKKIKRPLVQINMSQTMSNDGSTLKYGKSVIVNADNKRVGTGKFGLDDLYIVSYKDGKVRKVLMN